MPTAAELKNLIVVECNLAEDANLATYVDTYWDMFESALDDNERYLRTKRRTLMYVMGQLRKMVNLTVGGTSVSSRGAFQNAKEMYEAVCEEIKALSNESSSHFGTLAPTGDVPDTIEENFDLEYEGGMYI